MYCKHDVSALLGKRGIKAQLGAYGRFRRNCPPYLLGVLRGIRREIATIPDVWERRVLALCFVELMPLHRAAKILRMSERTARRLLQGALLHLENPRYGLTPAGESAACDASEAPHAALPGDTDTAQATRRGASFATVDVMPGGGRSPDAEYAEVRV